MDYTVHRVSKSQTQLSDFHFHFLFKSEAMEFKELKINKQAKIHHTFLLTDHSAVSALSNMVAMSHMELSSASQHLKSGQCNSGTEFPTVSSFNLKVEAL